MNQIEVIDQAFVPNTCCLANVNSFDRDSLATATIEHECDITPDLLTLSLDDYSTRCMSGPIGVLVTIAKMPTRHPINLILTYDDPVPEQSKLAQLMIQAEKISHMPEVERPGALVSLIRDNIKYPYRDPNLIGRELSREEQAFADRILSHDPYVGVSEVCEFGIGICGHFAAVFQKLSNSAKLESDCHAAFCHLTNIRFPQSDRSLFKSFQLGTTLRVPHAWNEVFLSNGELIPVDATTGLVGTSLDHRFAFIEAGYRTTPCFHYGIELGGNDKSVDLFGERDPSCFLSPGERYKTILISLPPTTEVGELCLKFDRSGTSGFSYYIESATFVQGDFVKVIRNHRK